MLVGMGLRRAFFQTCFQLRFENMSFVSNILTSQLKMSNEIEGQAQERKKLQ